MNPTITPLAALTPAIHPLVAELLQEAFVAWPESWPTYESALQEVEESLEPDRISLIALLDGEVIGWVGGISTYKGRVWELHPPRRRCTGSAPGRGPGVGVAARARSPVIGRDHSLSWDR